MTDPTSRREEIARIIDPHNWSIKDRGGRLLPAIPGDPDRSSPCLRSSLAKADAILASDGGREILAEFIAALDATGRSYAEPPYVMPGHSDDECEICRQDRAVRRAHDKAKEWLERMT